jgi:hypothetical protein
MFYKQLLKGFPMLHKLFFLELYRYNVFSAPKSLFNSKLVINRVKIFRNCSFNVDCTFIEWILWVIE